MKRLISTGGMLLVVATLFESVAFAQIPQYTTGPRTGTGGPTLKRSNRPVVSAYSGLLGSASGANSSFGYQYFTRVQPQVNTQRALRSLGQNVNRLQAQASAAYPTTALTADQQSQLGGVGGAIGPTGHATGYLTHSSYFGTNSARGGTSAGGTSAYGAPRGTAAPPVVGGASGPSSALPIRR